MTTTSQHADLERLHHVIPGAARFTHDTVTLGTYADGGDVSLPTVDTHRARHLTVIGDCGAGKTSLLNSLRAGAGHAGIEARLADPLQNDAHQIIAEHHELMWERDKDLAGRGARSGVGVLPLRLLLVDHLEQIGDPGLDMLTDIVRAGPKVGLAVVVAAYDLTAMMPGGALMKESLAVHNIVRLRSAGNDLPRHFVDGSTTAGVGFVNGDLFRAWWPGSGGGTL